VKYKYDRDADAIYVYLSSDKYSHGEDLDEDRRIDYSSDNKPIGVELLSVSKGVNLDSLPETDEITVMLSSEGVPIYTMYQDTYANLYGGRDVAFYIQLMPLGYEERKQPNEIIKEEVTACR